MIDTSTLIQVQDDRSTWHAAHVGRGVLCIVARMRTDERGHVGDLVDTVAWAYGLDRVTCWDCQQAVRALEVAAA